MALSGWIADRLGTRDALVIAIDGKCLRGSADGALAGVGVYLLSAYVQDTAAVLAQVRVDGKTNEHKAALAMLGVLPLSGAVVTADAMFTHADFATAILQGGLPVKENQPSRQADLALAFETPEGLSPLAAAPSGVGSTGRPVGR